MIKSLFGAMQMPESTEKEPVPELFQSRSEVYRTVPNIKKDRSGGVSVRKWYEKQAENGVSDRWKREKVLVFLILATIAILSAYAAADFRLTLAAVLVLASYSIAADPLRLTRRRFSRNSRLIIGLSLVPVIVFMAHASVRTIAVAAGFAGVSILVAVAGNNHWLSVESYKTSKHVLKALQPDDNTDHRDACLTAWQADGAREVVAAAASMGAYDCEEIEWQARKAAYTIGFCRASVLSEKFVSEHKKLANELATIQDKYEKATKELKELDDLAENYKAYKDRLQRAEEQARRGASAEIRAAKLEEENRKLQQENDDLKAANDELIKTADNPTLAEEIAEERTMKRLEEAARLGLSVRQTETFANVSHRRAAEFLKEWKEKKGAENES